MSVLDKVSDQEIETAFRERFRIKDGEIIKSSEKAAEHLMTYLGGKLDRECFVVMFLNGRNQLLSTEVLFRGSLTSATVFPRIILQRILELGAAAIICAHNHPSGQIQESADDRQITRKIREACLTIDVSLHDHLVITPGGDYLSFADKGLI